MVSDLVIFCFYINVHIHLLNGSNFDSSLHKRKPHGKYLRTAVSGLSEQYPEEGTKITSEEKKRLIEISDEIVRNPLVYFSPGGKDANYFSFYGGMLSFRTGYTDKFCNKLKRSEDIVYAKYTRGGSDKAVIFLPPKNGPIGMHYHLEKAMQKENISSISFMLPEHERRKTDPNLVSSTSALESQDPIFSASVYGHIEQVLQTVGDLMLTIDWLESRGYRHFAIYGQSTSTNFPPIMIALDPRVNMGVFIIPGIEAAQALWVSVSTPHVRKMYENAGVSMDELQRFWRCTSPLTYLKIISYQKRLKAKTYVALSKKDLVYPYSLQKIISQKIKESIPKTTIEEFSLAHSPLIIRFLLKPERIAEYIKENLGN